MRKQTRFVMNDRKRVKTPSMTAARGCLYWQTILINLQLKAKGLNPCLSNESKLYRLVPIILANTNVVEMKMLMAANCGWLYTYQEYSNLLYVDDVS